MLGMRNGTSQSPFRPALGDSLYVPRYAPLRGHGFGTSRLRQGPYGEWLDGVSDALAYRLRWLRDLRPLRHCGDTLAPTPTADVLPASRCALPWRAALAPRFVHGYWVYTDYTR